MQLGKRRVILAAALLILLGGASVGSWYIGRVQQQNADQAQIFAYAVANQPVNYLQPIGATGGCAGASVNATSGGNSTNKGAADCTIATGSAATFAITVFSPKDTYPNQTDIIHGVPDCLQFCKGVHYFLDPTVLITNQGRGIEQCLVYGSTSTDTCTSGNFAKVMGWSTSSATPANTDTYAGGAGQACSSTNEITDANGLADAAGTVTPGANGSPTTTTISKTFTMTGSYSNVQAAGLYSATNGGTNPLLYACATFGPDSFASSDTLTGTWTIART